jgi:hypothetical protein
LDADPSRVPGAGVLAHPALEQLSRLPPPSALPMTNATPTWPHNVSTTLSLFIGILLFPLRVVLLITLVAISLLLCHLILAGHQHGAPLTPTRRALVASLVRPLIRVLFLIVGISVRENGVPPSGDARVIVCNHVAGLWEGAFLLWRARVALIVDAANSRAPILSTWLRAFETAVVSRNAPGGGARTIADAVAGAGPPLGIFPEAVCSSGQTLLAFKSGAFTPLRPVTPVVVRFRVRAGGADPAYVSVGPRLLTLVSRLLFSCPFAVELEATWLPTVHPPALPPAASDAATRDAVNRFKSQVREDMARGLGVGLSSFSVDDAMLAVAARAARWDPQFALIDFAKVQALVRVSTREAAAVVCAFARAGPGGDGRLDADRFGALLDSLRREEVVPRVESETDSVSRALIARRLANAIGGPRISLREAIVGLAVVDGREVDRTGDDCRLAFAALFGDTCSAEDFREFGRALSLPADVDVDAAFSIAADPGVGVITNASARAALTRYEGAVDAYAPLVRAHLLGIKAECAGAGLLAQWGARL